jgi:hypothetical protein
MEVKIPWGAIYKEEIRGEKNTSKTYTLEPK